MLVSMLKLMVVMPMSGLHVDDCRPTMSGLQSNRRPHLLDRSPSPSEIADRLEQQMRQKACLLSQLIEHQNAKCCGIGASSGGGEPAVVRSQSGGQERIQSHTDREGRSK